MTAGCTLFAARYLDFAVLTDRPPRAVLDRLLHPPAPPARVRASRSSGSRSTPLGEPSRSATSRVAGDFRPPLRLELRPQRPSRTHVRRTSCSRARAGRRLRTPPTAEESTHDRRDRDRRGHHRRARVRGRRATARRAHASYREFPQHFPQPGWVEHDADDIWRVTVETLAEVARRARRRGRDGRRDRHHQPARDGRRVGPAHRRARGTARSCGRTGAPRRAATSCATRATSR